MASELDKLKGLKGKKIADIKLEWDDALDDYFIESIIFEDGTVLDLWGRSDFVSWVVDDERFPTR